MPISEPLKREIIEYCKTAEPNEACGFVVLDYQKNAPLFLPCENVAVDPENYFEISPDDFIRAEQQGEIIAVVHSHPNGTPKLSVADRQMQDLLQLDFWLVCDNALQIFPKIRPLVGRAFSYGTEDCFTLFCDFFRLAGIDFPNVERSVGWWQDDPDRYLCTLQKFGFQTVSEPQVGDVLLMCFGANVPNHAAIYLGDQQILQHTNEKRLSRRECYNDYWQRHTHSIWRLSQWHLSQLDFTVPLNHLARSFSLM